MYACFAFFPDGSVKKWKYVTNLTSFMLFLTKSHPAWKYFNVYEKGSKQFLKRFYPGNTVPKILGVLLLSFWFTYSNALSINKKQNANPPLSVKNTFGKTTFSLNNVQQAINPLSVKNTFNKATFNETTFINGFNNSATIPTVFSPKEGGFTC